MRERLRLLDNDDSAVTQLREAPEGGKAAVRRGVGERAVERPVRVDRRASILGLEPRGLVESLCDRGEVAGRQRFRVRDWLAAPWRRRWLRHRDGNRRQERGGRP